MKIVHNLSCLIISLSAEGLNYLANINIFIIELELRE
jgi:hypothetical protein